MEENKEKVKKCAEEPEWVEQFNDWNNKIPCDKRKSCE